jgi:hypothetical protein
MDLLTHDELPELSLRALVDGVDVRQGDVARRLHDPLLRMAFGDQRR